MTDQPRLRSALTGLASGRSAPGDPVAVVARAGRLRRRRAVATSGVALSLAGVLGGAVAFRQAPGQDVLSVTTEPPSPSVSAEGGTPTSAPPASATPSPTVIGPKPAPPPSGAPESPSASPAGTAGPSAASGGTVVTVAVGPGSAGTGDEVTVRVRVTDVDGTWTGASIDFGDGTATTMRSVAACPPGGSDRARPEPSDRTREFAKVYPKAGRYVVTVTATTMRPCADTTRESVTATDTVVVAGPDAPANGPEEPSAEAQNAKVSGRRATFDLVAYDDDGVPASYRVDWGDGTTASDGTFARNGCPEVGTRGYPRDTVSVPVSHDYARPGTYTVTITVTSTGCGGGDEQRGSVTWTAQVPLVGVPRQER